MRVEITYKFIMGFIIVVASIVLLNLLVPKLGIAEIWQQLVSTGGAILVGLAPAVVIDVHARGVDHCTCNGIVPL